MFVKLGKTEYKIEFNYGCTDEEGRRAILCQVRRIKDGKLIAESWSSCSPSDNYNRNVGRRIALARTIQEWIPRKQVDKRKSVWGQLALQINLKNSLAIYFNTHDYVGLDRDISLKVARAVRNA